jgi:hypothetical protein
MDTYLSFPLCTDITGVSQGESLDEMALEVDRLRADR